MNVVTLYLVNIGKEPGAYFLSLKIVQSCELVQGGLDCLKWSALQTSSCYPQGRDIHSLAVVTGWRANRAAAMHDLDVSSRYRQAVTSGDNFK